MIFKIVKYYFANCIWRYLWNTFHKKLSYCTSNLFELTFHSTLQATYSNSPFIPHCTQPIRTHLLFHTARATYSNSPFIPHCTSNIFELTFYSILHEQPIQLTFYSILHEQPIRTHLSFHTARATYSNSPFIPYCTSNLFELTFHSILHEQPIRTWNGSTDSDNYSVATMLVHYCI